MPDTLYHYTSMNTLLAILNNIVDGELTLRATHVNYLNDPTENEIGVDILKKELLKYESGLNKSEKKKLNENLDDERLSYFKNIDYDKQPPYIFSLSEDKDSLPMWNTYADNSLGVNIGFDFMKLEYLMEHNDDKKLIKCDYDHSKIEHFIKNNIKDLYRSITIDKYFIGVYSGADRRIWNDFEKQIPYLKHPSYSYEREWRIILTPPFEYDSDNNFKEVEFQIKDGIPKPYRELKINQELIKSIEIGPCSNFNLVSKSLMMLLNKLGLKSSIGDGAQFSYEKDFIIINQSNSPYRQL